MAKAKDTQVIEPQDVEDLDELLEDEAEETEETQVIRPNDLAEELGVDGKRIRAYLRQEFTRDSDSKNTNWELTPEMAAKVRDRFTASDEPESDEESDDEES